jgi:hypothetical protein
LIGLFNPGKSPVTTTVRINQGSNVDRLSARIPPGKTVKIAPHWLTANAVTVQAVSSVVPVRIQTG